MFIYKDNEATKAELKKLLIDKGVTAKEVAERMGVKPQQYNNIVNKQNLSLSDLNRIAAALGCKLAISFVD
ncbi:MAG: helix-turn-helix domain-containing protein [Eubacterium sp.]|nr:helix-turn-helix domain-containing protein [Eubacterium sp.]